ncbi:MAG: hypothetical protein AB8B73_11155 [Ekhidna sp.]
MIDEKLEERIIDEINRSSIKKQTLKDDLIDHFCCLVEIEMDKGVAFEEALKKAHAQTAPNGLNEIQEETIFLLNYSKIIFMKRLMYATGYLFSLALIVGVFLKLMSVQGSFLLMFSGVSGLAFIFLPMVIINRYKKLAREVLTERLKWILGFASLFLFVIASWMKFAHLMGAPVVLGLSFLVFGFGFLPFLFFRMYKKSAEEI